MKRSTAVFLILLTLLSACSHPESSVPEETTTSETAATAAATVPTTSTLPTVPAVFTEPAPIPHTPVPVVDLTPEEKNMLLQIGMAEQGKNGCTECIALIMCTVRNRVEAGRFGSSIRSVIFAQDQFTPVADGSYYKAEPNELCYDALEMVLYGWDESQGALYYEWCEGESWHSKNLHLLFQHCDTRFYD